MDYKNIISLLSKALNTAESIQVFQYIDSLKEKISNLSDDVLAQKEQIEKLNAQIADHDTWEKDKSKYEIIKISDSTFAYRLIGTSQIFCPKCFNDSRVPIHIRPPKPTFQRAQQCPKCKSEYINDTGS